MLHKIRRLGIKVFVHLVSVVKTMKKKTTKYIVSHNIVSVYIRGIIVHKQVKPSNPSVVCVELGLQLDSAGQELRAVVKHLGAEVLPLLLHRGRILVAEVSARCVADEPAVGVAYCTVYHTLTCL